MVNLQSQNALTYQPTPLFRIPNFKDQPDRDDKRAGFGQHFLRGRGPGDVRDGHRPRSLGCAIACAQLWPNNSIRLSRIDWLWSAKRASVGSRRNRRRVKQGYPLMRIYIIGSDGITLCRKAPATLNDGEIAVASNEELHAAPLSAKRLLALWNALPGVEKRKKVGDRDALIDQLWSAIELLPVPQPQPDPKRPSKQDVVIAMLRQPEGATVDEVASVTGWQRHTVRGVFSGTLRKKLGLTLASAKEERGRVYRIAEPASL